MLYLYDNAIAEDLRNSLVTDNMSGVVRVVDSEGMIELAAQIENDEIQFPLISLFRDPDSPIDTARYNFTRLHKGVATVFDAKTNMLYHEQVLPVKISYNMTIMTTNTADMDELRRELMFKYIQQYFLTITLPYESDRKIRFGVALDPDSVSTTSGTAEFLHNGALYTSSFKLNCEGCVMVNYRPVLLKRTETQIDLSNPT